MKLKDNPVVPVLLGLFTALLALLAAFGGADGARRNHEVVLFLAFAVVGIALALGGISTM